MTDDTRVRAGLEGVVVAETRLSDVDGERGRLVIAGHDVETIPGNLAFEDLCALLWDAPPAEVRVAVGEGRVRAFEGLGRLGDALGRPSGMDALRASLAHLTLDAGDVGDAAHAGPGQLRAAARLAGATAVFTAAWLRILRGSAPVPPDPRL